MKKNIYIIFGVFTALFLCGLVVYYSIFPTNIIEMGSQQYVAQRISFQRTRIYYHKYINDFVYEKEPFLIEDYGKGSFNPFDSSVKEMYHVRYQYQNGNIIYYKVEEKK